MRRSAVDALIEWHRSLSSPYLPHKLEKLIASPFGFFRGTFFLFAADQGNFKPFLKTSGPIIGDIHTENYGTFRSVTGDIVFDINDFDETANSLYEYDVRRLAVSLILAALENQHRLGDGLNAAEAATREWLNSLARWRHLNRKQFSRLPPHDVEKMLLSRAAERSRSAMITDLAEQSEPGRFVFKTSAQYPPATAKEREAAEAGLPLFLDHCLAPANAKPAKYVFHDAARRIAGNGSLGRPRFAILLGKGEKGGDSLTSLRLIEWKQALDSSLDAAKPKAHPKRAREVFESTCHFQVHPKRYLGFTKMMGLGMQAREIGANDRRFSAHDYHDPRRLEQVAALFGHILARCHLLASIGKPGPREIPGELHTQEDRFVHEVLQFAMDYAAQVRADHAALVAARAKIEKAWRSQKA